MEGFVFFTCNLYKFPWVPNTQSILINLLPLPNFRFNPKAHNHVKNHDHNTIHNNRRAGGGERITNSDSVLVAEPGTWLFSTTIGVPKRNCGNRHKIGIPNHTAAAVDAFSTLPASPSFDGINLWHEHDFHFFVLFWGAPRNSCVTATNFSGSRITLLVLVGVGIFTGL